MRYGVDMSAVFVVFKNGNTHREICHTGGVLEAVSMDEAIGIADRLCRRLYPPQKGWCTHYAYAFDLDIVIDPEKYKLDRDPTVELLR